MEGNREKQGEAEEERGAKEGEKVRMGEGEGRRHSEERDGRRREKEWGGGFGTSPRPGGLAPLGLLVGHSQKRQNKQGRWEGLQALQWGGKPSRLLCFKIGIKQYYFGFCAVCLASGGGWGAQSRREMEMVQHSFIISVNKA